MALSRFITFSVASALFGLVFGLAVGSHAMGLLYPKENSLLHQAEKTVEPDPSQKTYFELGQFVVPVVLNGRTQAFVLAEITVSLETEEQKKEAAKHLPHYRDAALQSLYAYAGTGAFTNGSFDPGDLAERMVGDLNTTLGTAVVDQVLFNRLMLQDNLRS
ncbi:flagellar basal body-associated FliL family protein [Rhodospirillaceae bacterium SYSU D60014]|uniref:flagellar basal body-associated FliL family protein n=1 Tax=Virgifigura deserti TaxID=2268457 RepID=UPI000E66ED1F